MATITGTPGNDTLTSSTPGAILQGGRGDDLYIINGTGVTVAEAASEGTDKIQTSLTTFSIANTLNVENLSYTGTQAFTGTGNTGNNILTGGTGNDLLNGDAGNDTLIGGAGADTLIGGAGTDTASYVDATSGVRINLASHEHTGIAMGDTYESIEIILGSNYNDTFVGDANGNAFNGGAGVDTIDYSASAEAVSVNLTTNVVSGGDAQGDTLSAIEKVIGSGLNDTLASSTTTTMLQGGAGDDLYIVNGTGITISEASAGGDDEILTTLATFSMASTLNVEKLSYTGALAFSGTGNSANNTLTGGIGTDVLNGGAGNDVLNGACGNDTLIGGNGADQLMGGAGIDTASYADSATGLSINLATHEHTGIATGDTYDDIEVILGSAYNDSFVGDANGNAFSGGAGVDTIDYSASSEAVSVNLTTNVVSGGDAQGDTLTAIEKVIGTEHNDTLASSTTATTLQGGAGDDLYIVNGTGVIVSEATGSGDDEIQTTLATFSMASTLNVEKLSYTGTLAFTGTGNSANNTLSGGLGNDVLNGGSGNDTLNGGAGNDSLLGGAGADQLMGGAGVDTASYADSATGLSINLATNEHTGIATGDTYESIEVILGSNYNDSFVGDANGNAFNGGTGIDTIDYSASAEAVSVNLTTNVVSGGDAQGDTLTAIEKVIGTEHNDTLASSTTATTLQGGIGDDLYIVNGTGVIVSEATGSGDDEILTTLATFSMASTLNVEKLSYTGALAFSGTGNAEDNILTGGIGTDRLNGGLGNDTLLGGAGDDTLLGGTGTDQLVGGAGIDTASYADSAAALSINLATHEHTGIATGDTYESIEVILGSNYNDSFVGDTNGNAFNGGTGVDTIDYSASEEAVSVNLTTNVVSGGDAQGDTLTAIEKVIGSNLNDTLASSTTATTLQGGAGDDLYIVNGTGVIVSEATGSGDDEIQTSLATFSMASTLNVEKLSYTGALAFSGSGNAEDNILTGGIGNDVLNGGIGNDTLNGGAGNDSLLGGAGADQFIGGAGIDTASYADSAAALSINLATNEHTGIATGDTYESIEIILGSNYNDSFVGDANGNAFNGNIGIDTIDYSASAEAVSVNLTTNVVSGGDAQGDTLTAIEKVIGSGLNDTLASSTTATTLQGGAGDDLYLVNGTGVIVSEATGSGDDEIQTSLTTFSMASTLNVEKLSYTGALAFSGTGNADDNILTGGIGNDSLNGGAGNDVLNGGAGNDSLLGGAGADQFIGGAGIDTASYADSAAALSINLATNEHTGIATGDTYESIEIILGSNYNDSFVGDDNGNAFNGNIGIDTIDYSASSEAVSVNLTTNVVSGGDAQGDTLTAIEKVIGSGLNDTLASSTTATTLQGGAGDDLYLVNGTGVIVSEATGSGDDEIQTTLATFSMASTLNVEKLSYTGALAFSGTGNAEDNILTGGIGTDVLNGGIGNDTLNGGAGNDTLLGGAGADQFVGGAGIDTASYADSAAALSINLATNEHTGIATGDTYESIEVILGSNYNDSFVGDDNGNAFNGNIGIDTIDYSASSEAVSVNLTTNVVSGGDAQGDTLTAIEKVIGSGLNDTLASSTTATTLQGGAGDDLYLVNGTGVTVVESDYEGIDEVQTTLATLSIAAYANVEKLSYTGALAFTGTGNAGDNALSGGIGNDVLNGSAGNDTLNGGAGSDTLSGGAGADQLVGGAGSDTASYADAGQGVSINLATHEHTGIATGDTYDDIEVILGSAYNDSFVGDDNGNSFNGGAGVDTIDYSTSVEAVSVNLTTNVVSGGDAQSDTLSAIEKVIGSGLNDTLASSTTATTLQGGAGDDLYVVNGTGVTVVETDYEGIDEVQTSLATLSIAAYANVEKLRYSGTQAFTGTGNAGDNTLSGGTGNDVLNGGAGNDTLLGGAGNDTLSGGAGADQLVGGAGSDTASYADAGQGVSINLATHEHTGIATGDTYDDIEIILGSAYNDSFVGDDNGNTFNGGTGVDTIDYSTSVEAVSVNLTTNVVSGGDAQGDTLTAIEKVIGSGLNDTLASSTTATTLQGGAGDDLYVVNGTGVTVVETDYEGIDEVQTSLATLSIAAYANVEKLSYTGALAFSGTGNAEDNILTGGIGTDSLNGGAGNDTLNGGAGNDTLSGGAGADQLVGGAGIDIASYADAGQGVSINLITHEHTGIATGDTYDDIEVILGSAYNDSFVGDDNGNAFNGGAGVDTIDYSASAEAVSVNLTTNVVSGGDAQGDTLTAIEKVIGSNLNDTLASSTTATTLQGGAGDDLYLVNSTGITVSESIGGGIDEVQTTLATLSIAAYANVEKLSYTGTQAFTGTGNAEDNILSGGAGNDTLLGGAGADRFFGNSGTDTVSYADSASGVSINLETGENTGIAAGDTYDSIAIIAGSNHNDSFVGDANGNAFNGGNGIDTIDYSASSEAVSVNLTTNAVSGGDAQSDTLTAIEKVIGSDFNDALSSWTTGHTLQGGAGDDLYLVNSAGVTVSESIGGGIDEVQTAFATLSIAGYANVEKLSYIGTSFFTGTGNAEDNTLTGGNGNDTLQGGAGADQLIGRSGTDTASYADASAGVTINLATGEHTGIAEGDTYDSIEAFLGSSYGDTFVANAAATRFNGGNGADTVDYSVSSAAVNVNLTTNVLSGGDAQGDTLASIEQVIGSDFNDTLTSSTSGHALHGGGGDDLFIINGTGVSVLEAAGGGSDEIRTALATYSLADAAHVERLSYTGNAAFTGSGNAEDNLITGGTGNDTLSGGAGADEFHGGAGRDIVSYSDSGEGLLFNFATGVFSGIANGDSFFDVECIVGSGQSDVLVENADHHAFDGAGGYDIVSYEAASAGITINLATATQTDIAAGDDLSDFEVIQGSTYDDTFVGDAADNRFMGGAGADTIEGGAGTDGAWYLSSTAAVEIDLLNGALVGGDAAGDSLSSIENLAGSSFADTLTGNALANRLDGGEGNDTISGGEGNDTIFGGFDTKYGIVESDAAQADVLRGGGGNDEIMTAGNDAASEAYGGDGDDIIIAMQGIARGGEGKDTISVESGKGYGEAGDDTLRVNNAGLAHGDEGNDTLTGTGNSGYTLYGDGGGDTFDLRGPGSAFGGAGADIYYINCVQGFVKVDDGAGQANTVRIPGAETILDMGTPKWFGDNLRLSVMYCPNGGVELVGWRTNHFIDTFMTANNVAFSLDPEFM